MSRTRRLAAILAADVAGYSRLMGKDEEGTLAIREHLPLPWRWPMRIILPVDTRKHCRGRTGRCAKAAGPLNFA